MSEGRLEGRKEREGAEGLEGQTILREIAQYILSDSPLQYFDLLLKRKQLKNSLAPLLLRKTKNPPWVINVCFRHLQWMPKILLVSNCRLLGKSKRQEITSVAALNAPTAY